MPHTDLYHARDEGSTTWGFKGRLDKKQTAALSKLKDLVKKESVALVAIAPGEQPDVCLLRYLRASNPPFDEKQALAALVDGVRWREQVGVAALRGIVDPDLLAELATAAAGSPSPAGPTVSLSHLLHDAGADSLGRPVTVLRVAALVAALKQMQRRALWGRFAVWTIERAQARLVERSLATQKIVESLTLVLDFTSFDPSLFGEEEAAIVRDVVAMAKLRYPGRLGALLVANSSDAAVFVLRALGIPAGSSAAAASSVRSVSSVGSGAQKVGTSGASLVPPRVRVVSTQELLSLVPASQLPASMGGSDASLAAGAVSQGASSRSVRLSRVGSSSSAAAASDSPSATAASAATAGAAQGGRTELLLTGRKQKEATVGVFVTPVRGAALLSALLLSVHYAPAVTEAGLVLAIVALLTYIWWQRSKVRRRARSGSVSGRSDSNSVVPTANRTGGESSANVEGGEQQEQRRCPTLRGSAVDVTEVRERGGGGFEMYRLRIACQPANGNALSDDADADDAAALQWTVLRRGFEFCMLHARLEELGLISSHDASSAERGSRGAGGASLRTSVDGAGGSGAGSGGGGAGSGGGGSSGARSGRLERRVASANALSARDLLADSEEVVADDGGLWNLPPTLEPPALAEGFEAFVRGLLALPEACDHPVVRGFLGAAPLPQPSHTVPLRQSSEQPPNNFQRRPVSRGMRSLSETRAADLEPRSGGGGSGNWRSNSGSGSSGGGGGSFASQKCGVVPLDAPEAAPVQLRSVRPQLRDVFTDAACAHSFRLSDKEAAAAVSKRGHFFGGKKSGKHGGSSTVSPPSSAAVSPVAAKQGGGLRLSPSRLRRAESGASSPAPSESATSAGVDSPESPMSGSSAASELSPRKRRLVSKLVGHVAGKVRRADHHMLEKVPATFRLAHADVFRVPDDNPLGRVDHIAALARSRAAARVNLLTLETETETHVVNANGPGGASGGGGGGSSSGGGGGSSSGGGGGSSSSGGNFVLVVNLQLPKVAAQLAAKSKSASAGGRAAVGPTSVVFYFTMPAEVLGLDDAASAAAATAASIAPPLSTAAAASATGGFAGLPAFAAADRAQPLRHPNGQERRTEQEPEQETVTAVTAGGLDACQKELLRRFVDLPCAEGFGAELEEALESSGYGDDERDSGILPDKDFRNLSFKVLAAVIEGPANVRKAIQPAVGGVHLPRKVTHRFFRGPRHLEIAIDVASSAAAESTVGMLLLLQNTICLDLGLHIEGFGRLLGCARVKHPDLTLAEPLLFAPGEAPGFIGVSNGQLAAAPAAAGSGADGDAAAALTRRALRGMFADIGAAPPFRLRGAAGRRQSQKAVAAGPALGKLLRADLYRVDGCFDAMWRADHIVRRGRAREVAAALLRAHPSCLTGEEMLWVVNLQTKGSPPLSLVLYFLVPLRPPAQRQAAAATAPAISLLRRYADIPFWEEAAARAAETLGVPFAVGGRAGASPAGGPRNSVATEIAGKLGQEELDRVVEGVFQRTDFRNRSLKVLPLVREGPWIVKRTVGSKPLLAGQHLTCRYFRGAGYVETDVDVASWGVAHHTTAQVVGNSRSLVADLGFCLQADADADLPERLVGCVRISHLDMSAAEPLFTAEHAAETAAFMPQVPAASKDENDASYHSSSATASSSALRDMLTDGGASPAAFKVRGVDYMEDSVKVPAAAAAGTLVFADLYSVEGELGRVDNICSEGQCRRAIAPILSSIEQGCSNDVLFVVNLQMPGNPPLSLVCGWRVKAAGSGAENASSEEYAKFWELFGRFVDLPADAEGVDEDSDEGSVGAEACGMLGPEDFRNRRFKLFPSVSEGSWLLRKTVGSTPTLIAQKLTCRYFRGANNCYFEVDVDIGSSTIAFHTASVACAAAKRMAVDIGFAVQGESPSELPERLIGAIRIKNLDTALAHPLNALFPAPSSALLPAHGNSGFAGGSGSSGGSSRVPPGSSGSRKESAAQTPSQTDLEGQMGLTSPALSGFFSDAGPGNGFKVRGVNYLTDRKKVPAARSLGRLARVDLFELPADAGRIDNIAAFAAGRAASHVAKLARSCCGPDETVLVLNLQVPGKPPFSLVICFIVPAGGGKSGAPVGGAAAASYAGKHANFRKNDASGKSSESSGSSNGGSGSSLGAAPDESLSSAPAKALLAQFLEVPSEDEPSVAESEAGSSAAAAGGGGGGSSGLGEEDGRLPGEDFRNCRFKLFPMMVEGPWIVRKAVGATPTLIAQKLTCRYFRGAGYTEVDIDIGSSVVAYNTVSLALGYAKAVVVDMGFCVQPESPNELPEMLIGAVRINRLDMAKAEPLLFDDGGVAGSGGGGGVAGSGGGGGGGCDANTAPSTPSPQPQPQRPQEGAVVPLTSPHMAATLFDAGGCHEFSVRGANYSTSDRHKVAGGAAMAKLVRADLFVVPASVLHRCDHVASRGKTAEYVRRLTLASGRPGEKAPFLLIVNMQLPGDPAYSLVCHWAIDLPAAAAAEAKGTLSEPDRNFYRLLRRFVDLKLEGALPPMDERNRRLKMFARVVQGPWVVCKAVSSRPTMIGQKVTARYFPRLPHYLEVDLDISTSPLGNDAAVLALTASKSVVVDIGFALQGESADELPERILGCVRVARPDVDRAEPLL